MERPGAGAVFTRGSREDRTLDLDTLFELLTSRRRRLLLRFLEEQPGSSVEFDDIVGYVHAWEEELGRTGPDHRRSIEVSMVHVHLPKLASADVVEYGDPTATVRYSSPPPLGEFLRLASAQGPIP